MFSERASCEIMLIVEREEEEQKINKSSHFLEVQTAVHNLGNTALK